MKVENLTLKVGKGNDAGAKKFFFDIEYTYSLSKEEFSSLVQTGNIIFEQVRVVGFLVSANPSLGQDEDFDLKIGAKPAFFGDPNNSNDFKLDATNDRHTRKVKRQLKEDFTSLSKILSDNLLDNVRCRLNLTIGQFGYSGEKPIG
jgi:hypothetical protein